MEEAKNTAADVLRSILAQDRSLLGKRDALIDRLDAAKDISFLDRNRLKNAMLGAPLNDALAAADSGTPEERAAALASVQETLKAGGMQDAQIETVLQTFVEALDWNKEPEPEPEPEPEKAPEETPAPPEPEAPMTPWDCACGQKGNTGKFCVRCGRSRADGETQGGPWTCQCGTTGNTGKFCVGCGRSRTEGEVPAGAAPQPAPQRTASQGPADDATQVLPRVQPPTYNPPPTPQPQPAASAASDKNTQSKLLIGLIAVLVIAIGAFIYKEMAGGTGASTYNSLAKSSSSSQGAAKQREMQSDLSLGGLDLDMSVDDVRKTLGKENSSEPRNQYNFLLYDNIEVGTYEGTVRALVSNGASVSTKRGIHEGSTLDDVKKAYSQFEVMVSDYGDLTLYEYWFKSIAGSSGILRFAINKSDQTVKYISVRIPEDEKPAASNNKADETAALQTLNAFYQGITSGKGRSSYDLLSADMQRHMGTYDQFIQGYQTTISHQTSDVNVASSGDGQVVLTYLLTARDRTTTKRVKVQTFRCEATLSKAMGSWHIVNIQATKQGERME